MCVFALDLMCKNQPCTLHWISNFKSTGYIDDFLIRLISVKVDSEHIMVVAWGILSHSFGASCHMVYI